MFSSHVLAFVDTSPWLALTATGHVELPAAHSGAFPGSELCVGLMGKAKDPSSLRLPPPGLAPLHGKQCLIHAHELAN